MTRMKIFTKLIFTLILIICLVYFIVYLFTKKIDNKNKLANISTIQVKSSRTFIHSKEQLELTKVAKISPKQCNKSKNISIFIHSAINYRRRRQTQRNTWVSEVKSRQISVYFVVGITKNRSEELSIWEESEKYGDLLQFDFIDDYYNNTLKAISILHWIQKYCKNTKFILKTDDDVLVNIDLLLHNLDYFKPGIHGLLFKRVKANRSEKTRWFMPKTFYEPIFYPVYNPGAAYIMTGDIIDLLVRGINEFTGNVIDIDDVFVTGIISQQMGVKRFRTKLVAKTGCWSKCSLYKYGVIFGCNKDNLLQKLWDNWKASEEKECFQKKLGQKSTN